MQLLTFLLTTSVIFSLFSTTGCSSLVSSSVLFSVLDAVAGAEAAAAMVAEVTTSLVLAAAGY